VTRWTKAAVFIGPAHRVGRAACLTKVDHDLEASLNAFQIAFEGRLTPNNN
jgi:hypothetical protein